MNENLTKVWVTKYALSLGIFTAMAELTADGNCRVPDPPLGCARKLHRRKDGCHEFATTEEAAIYAAEMRRLKKIAAVKRLRDKKLRWFDRKIQKLENQRIDVY